MARSDWNWTAPVCGILLHSVNDGLADVKKSDEMRLLYGRDFFMEKLFDLEFKVSVYSFFQTNSAGAEKLYSIVKEFAGDVADKRSFRPVLWHRYDWADYS